MRLREICILIKYTVKTGRIIFVSNPFTRIATAILASVKKIIYIFSIFKSAEAC